MLGSIGIFNFFKNAIPAIENWYIFSTIGAAGGHLLTNRINAVNQAIDNNYIKKAAIVGSLVGIYFILKTTNEIITTYLIAPSARIVQDIAGSLVNNYWDGYFGGLYAKNKITEIMSDVLSNFDQDQNGSLVEHNNDFIGEKII